MAPQTQVTAIRSYKHKKMAISAPNTEDTSSDCPLATIEEIASERSETKVIIESTSKSILTKLETLEKLPVDSGGGPHITSQTWRAKEPNKKTIEDSVEMETEKNLLRFLRT